MGFKMKGFSYPGKSPLKANKYESPFEYEKDPNKFAKRIAEQNDTDDQSKQGARNRGETCAKCDKLKGNCTCKEGPQDRPTVKKKSQEQIEDEQGVGTNIKTPKVMKDGSSNRAHYKGKVVTGWTNPYAVKPKRK